MKKMKKKCNVKGVGLDSKGKKWIVQLNYKNVHYYGGSHDTMEEAIKVRKKLEKKYIKPIVLKLKKQTNKYDCHILRCSEKNKVRGLCSKHYMYCINNDLLDLFASDYRRVKQIYKINKLAKYSKCRVIADGKICNKKSYARGLCQNHYIQCVKRDCLNKFGLNQYVNTKHRR